MLRRAALLVWLFASPALGEGVSHQTQSWFGLFASGPVAGRVMGWFDAHGRFAFEPASSSTTLLRPGLGYRVRDDMTVWLGYLWAPVWTEGALTLDEHRLWQQWTWDLPCASGAKVQLRTRFEQRFARAAVGLRLRQFVRAQTAPLQGTQLRLVAWDEAFVALNTTAFQRAGFDQNRLFLGLARGLTNSLRLEAGYFNQWLSRPGQADPLRHVAMVNAFMTW